MVATQTSGIVSSSKSVSATFTVTGKTDQATLSVTGPSSVTFGTTGTATASGGSGTGALTFSAGASTGCAVVGTTVSVSDASGTCVLTATKAGDTNYNPATSAPFTVTLVKANQAPLTLNAGSPLTYNTAETLTTTGGSGTGAVTFSLTSGSCTLLTNQLTANSGTGACVVGATKAADDNYNQATASATVTLQKADQAPLTLNAGSPLTYNTAETLTTTGGSGTGAVTFSLTSGSCTLLTNQLTANSGTGACVVGATKAADDNYNQATASATVTLQKADQAPLTLNAGSPLTYNTAETLTTTGGSGTGAVTFSLTSGSCTLLTNQLTANSGTGACVVGATKAADDNYNQATASATVTLQKADQAPLTLNAGSPLTYNTAETLTTTGGSGTGAVTFSLTSGSCTLLTNQLTANSGTGACVVGATKAADDNYNQATASATVTLQKADQAPLTLNAGSPLTYNTAETLTTTGGSGTGAVTFSLTSGSCTLLTNQLTANSGTGTCVVGATKAADDNYNQATASATVTLQKANQAPLTLNAGSPLTYNTAETLTTTGGSGTGAVTFSLTSGSCTLLTNQLTANSGTGACVVGATKAADDNYNQATASATVTLQKANQAPLTLNAGSPLTYNTAETLTTTGGSGTGAVTFSLTSGSCTLLTNQLTANSGTGTCVVGATKAADDNYNQATASATVTLQKANQAPLTLNAGSPLTYNTAETLTTTGGSGTGAVTFSLTSGSCTLLTNQLTANSGTGTCVVGATKAADNNYNQATASATVTLQKANQAALTLNAATPLKFLEMETLTTTGGSGTGAVTFSLTSGSCTLLTNQLTANSGTGTCVVGATKAADDNYNQATASATVTLIPRDALVNYIGQQIFVTSGSSATTAQVALSASLQDPTGTYLGVGARVDFIDATTGSTLAKGIVVSPVPGSPYTGTANTIVTLSTGQYGSLLYLIKVVATGNYDNSSQPLIDKTATVVVSKPATTNQTTGGGTIEHLGTAAGTYSGVGIVGYSVGITYNKSGSNLQGNIVITIPQADGSIVTVKSNSLSSMAVSGTTGPKLPRSTPSPLFPGTLTARPR